MARGLTGCRFAATFASQNQVLFSVFDSHAPPDQIDLVFDTAAEAQIPAVVILSAVRIEADLVRQLELLTTGDRWEVRRETVPKLVTDELLVGLRWKTSTGRTSLPMGFGPFGTMPATRRAPYACLATWPGQHENPHRTKYEEGVVDFLDSAPAGVLEKSEYKKLWSASVDGTTALLSDPADDANFYRAVAFRLGADAARSFSAK